MALDQPYKDVPGTTVFDAEMARKGYHLNQFCMSLMKAANREKFKAGERAYVDAWPMTEEQKACTRDRARLPGEFVARAGERRGAVRGISTGLAIRRLILADLQELAGHVFRKCLYRPSASLAPGAWP